MTETQINKLVQKVKNEGANTQAFEDLYNHFSHKIDTRFDNYLKVTNLNFNIDREQALSYVKYEWLLHCINQFKMEYSFEAYFYTFLTNGFVNGIRSEFSKNHEAHTFADSLNRQINDNTTLADIIEDKRQPDFSDQMLEVLENWKNKKGQEAYEIIMALTLEGKERSTAAILRATNSIEYDAALRQKVCRLKKEFAKFMK